MSYPRQEPGRLLAGDQINARPPTESAGSTGAMPTITIASFVGFENITVFFEEAKNACRAQFSAAEVEAA